jgi:hypothetical protein
MPGHPASPGLAAAVRTTLEVLALAFGPEGRTHWTVAGAGVLALIAVSSALLAVAVVVRPAERVRAFAVLCCLGAFTAVACAIGWGRSGCGEGAGLADHYALFTAPILCIAYIAFVLYAPRDFGRLSQVLLLTTLCATLPAAYREGKWYGIDRAERADALRLDAQRGMPPDVMAKRHENRIYPEATTLALRLEMLRQAGASVFAGVEAQNAEPCGREEAVATEPVATNQMEWHGARAVATGEDPFLIFALPSARFVSTIEVTFTLSKPNAAPATLEAFWMRGGLNEFEPDRRNEWLPVVSSTTEQTLTIWVNDTIDRFRLDPDTAPSEFEVQRIVLHER